MRAERPRSAMDLEEDLRTHSSAPSVRADRPKSALDLDNPQHLPPAASRSLTHTDTLGPRNQDDNRPSARGLGNVQQIYDQLPPEGPPSARRAQTHFVERKTPRRTAESTDPHITIRRKLVNINGRSYYAVVSHPNQRKLKNKRRQQLQDEYEDGGSGDTGTPTSDADYASDGAYGRSPRKAPVARRMVSDSETEMVDARKAFAKEEAKRQKAPQTDVLTLKASESQGTIASLGDKVIDMPMVKSSSSQFSLVSSTSTAALVPSGTASSSPTPSPTQLGIHLFIVLFLMELLTALTPLYRVIDTSSAESTQTGPSSEDNNSIAVENQLKTVFTANVLRIVLLFGMIYRIRGADWHKECFVFDPLLIRGTVYTLSYMGMLFSVNSNWYKPALASDFLFVWVFSAYTRLMVKIFPWFPMAPYHTLLIYKWLKILFVVVQALIGTVYLFLVPSSSNRTLYIFYVLCAMNYWQDCYMRVLTIPIPPKPGAPAAPAPKPADPEQPTGFTDTIRAVFQNKIPVTQVEFFLIFIIEFLSSSYPLMRLDQSDADVETSSSLTFSLFFDICRSIFFTFTLWRLRKSWRAVLEDIIALDNLLSRELATIISYIGLTADTAKSSAGWIAPAVFFNVVLTLLLVAHLRAMLSFAFPSRWHLRLYKMGRVWTPVCFLITIAIVTTQNKTSQFASFLLWVSISVFLWFDYFNKLWLVKNPKPSLTTSPSSANLDNDNEEEEQLTGLEKCWAWFTCTRTQESGQSGGPAASTLSFASQTSTVTGVVSKLTSIEFYLCVLVEILSSTSPATRLIDRKPLTDNATAQLFSYIIAAASTAWVRSAVWFCVSLRILGLSQPRALWKEYSRIDNLLGRFLLMEFALAFFCGSYFSSPSRAGIDAGSDALMHLVLSGHVRVILKYFPFTPFQLWVYRLNRFYAPCLYVSVGVYFVYSEPATSAVLKNLYVLYLIAGALYFYDIFLRTTAVADPKASTPYVYAIFTPFPTIVMPNWGAKALEYSCGASALFARLWEKVVEWIWSFFEARCSSPPPPHPEADSSNTVAV